MENIYKQLTLDERIEISRLDKGGFSLRMIARELGRAASTICREIKRNSKQTKQWPGGYEPARAERLAQRRRRWDCRFKMARQPDLRNAVRDHLAMGWSPEQIAGWLARQQNRMTISHESIYRYIYHRSAQKDYWHKLLPLKKHRRGRLKRGGISSVKSIKHRNSVKNRPKEADDRKQPGHWEADLMAFSKYGKVILVACERHSRLIIATIQANKKAWPVVKSLTQTLAGIPHQLLRTMTFDNGTEFAFHYRLQHTLGLQTYFCDPHAPWQKGGVENAILRLRRRLPRKTSLEEISQDQLNHIVAQHNNTPRKCLEYQTPAEVLNNQMKLLHFKRESIFPPARE